jgi:4-amino-4-deoxy-L-arabinose transferase-like glycosyltransferase
MDKFERWTRPSLVLGLTAFVLHLLFNAGYGIFRDELYFIVCGLHPAWGYVDQPPLVPLLAAGSYGLFGDWLTGFRLIPALSLSVVVGLTAEFARAVGGGRFAQYLAGLCALLAPFFLSIGMLFTTDTFQALSWLLCAWILVKLEQTKDERWWLAFGLVAGLSLLSKYMIAFYLVALAVGLLFTPLRRSLLRPWVYIGALVAALLVLPNVLWQQAHGWPFLELGQAAMNGKNIALSPLAYFTQQLLLIGFLSAPVWLCGLWAALYKPRYAVYRAIPIAYVLLFAFFVYSHGKGYFLTAIYPALFAIGAVAIEGWLKRSSLRAAVLTLVVVGSIGAVPLVLPMMSEEATIRYAAFWGLGPSATAAENLKQARLSQTYADMHGWSAMAYKVAAVYWTLPPDDRAKAVFFGNNYGDAAAVDIYGSRLGLPPAISGHNNYYLWGPRGHDGSVVIVIGGKPEDYPMYASVKQAGWLDDPYAMPYETNQPIYVLRGRKQPLARVWSKRKHFD